MKGTIGPRSAEGGRQQSQSKLLGPHGKKAVRDASLFRAETPLRILRDLVVFIECYNMSSILAHVGTAGVKSVFSPSDRFSPEPVLRTVYEDNSFLSFVHDLNECSLHVTNESGSFCQLCLLHVTSLISAEN
jgi:hypothetical protein